MEISLRLEGSDNIITNSHASLPTHDTQVDRGHVSFHFPATPLTTLSHYLNRMRNEFSLNSFDNQSKTSTLERNEAKGFRSTVLQSATGGFPTPSVIRSTQ